MTLVDTKKVCLFLRLLLALILQQTIRRMREMSRFSCIVTVFVDGACKFCSFRILLSLASHRQAGVDTDSGNLVPGDVIKLSHSQFSFFPADMLLLSGDSIVNESMLTGESVPVSKVPIKTNDLLKWREEFDDVGGQFSRHLLHSGTKVVRIRGAYAADGSPEVPAIALVVRTGEGISDDLRLSSD